MENEENQKQVFHRFPQPLEIAKARFPHSHSPGYDREEKWKSKSRIPTFPSRLFVLLRKKKGDSPEGRVPVVQAHRSIRICSVR
jgi:hypothetical protein